ncbi:MAG TPA: G1 family glutamic endopeptidase [Streptosporangiaceae bacterium]|jgi:hypothetical protein
MKRLLSMAATGLMCGAMIMGASGVAGASSNTIRLNVGQPGGPLVRAPGHGGEVTISENWSGYAATTKSRFTSVHGTFIQPTIKCTGAPHQWTSNWVGLDGFADQTVEQDGTFATCGGPDHMTPRYTAWYEMFPAGSVPVFSVNPGDIMDMSVNFNSSGQFVLTDSDLTSGKSHTFTATCASCSRSSAEWIIERPATCNSSLTKCVLTALVNFGTSTMSASTASLTGGPVKNIGNFNKSPIFMVQPIKRGFISLDTVSALSGPSFTARWDRSGTPIPIQLGPKH